VTAPTVPQTLSLTRGDLAASRCHGGTEPVIIVPGYFGSKEDFWPLFPGIAAAGYDVWSYDQLGQYDSGGPDEPEHYTVDLLAGDLREAVERIGGDRPVHLVGHCLGGFVARTLTLAAPERVASLTLLACGPALHHRRHAMMLGGLSKYLKDGPHDAVSRRIEKVMLEGAGPWFEHTRDKMERAKPGFLWGMAHSMYAEPDRTAELYATGVPVFVLYGSVGGRLWSRRDFVDLAERLNAPSFMVADCAHQPAMEQPGVTTDALVRFFARAARPVGAP
jgi:pimeloyl-ACP methyl ester carboxylesterase